jgi:tetratricopeptide (TPR) repeat protein
MQESVKRYAEGVRREHGITIRIRVGLNSGEVVVRAISSDLHMDYTAVGQTTHLAARMEQLADPGAIVITPETLLLAEGYVEVKSLGPVPVKGLAEAVDVYELTGAGTARTRLQAAALRGLTRFVGRDAEVDHLRRVLGQAGGGRGQVVAIVGEAGVGKSRLTYEFTHSHRVQDWLILEASSVSYGKATSYLPVIDLLKGYFKIGDRDDHREMRAKVLGRVLGLDRALEPLLPPLLALLDVPVEDTGWQNLDPPQRRQRTLDAVKRLLLHESQAQPLLVVFEDLHWIDGETQALLDSLAESLGSARLLLLVNYRPEYEHHWGSKTAYSQLRLDSLPAESTAELLAALLGPDPGLAPLTPMLVKRGNPFFLEETVRTLVETGALVGQRGAYRLTRPVEALQVPATVQTILAARIDRLPAEEKRLLQTAAVIGKDVLFALLQAVADMPEESLRRGLTHLQAAEFLYETSLFPDLEYTFKHALTHQVAYGSLLQDRRRPLHARILDAIEALYPERLTEHVERLARHALRGEVWDKAVTYLRQAGTKMAGRLAYQEAVSCFEQALVALKQLPESRETTERAIELHFSLRNALLPLGENRRTFDHLRAAETLAQTINDQRRLGRTYAYLAEYFRMTGDLDGAVESGERALTLATTLGDFVLQVMATFFAGVAYHTLGDYRRAEDFFSRNVASLTGDLIRERFGMTGFPSVMARAWLVSCLAELGEFANGTERGEEAVRIAESLDHPFSLTQAHFGLGHLYLRKGDLDKALPTLERSLGVCRAASISTWFPGIAGALGYAYALSGRVAEALPLLKQAVEQVEQKASMGAPASHSRHVAYLSEAYLLAGRIGDATPVGLQALALSRKHKGRGYEAHALRLVGEIASRHDPTDVENAEEHYRRALDLATELCMRPLVAHCHLGLGKLSRRAGDGAKAQEHLETASAMYREMDMGFYLALADAELGGVER